jgi:hypothetical protein
MRAASWVASEPVLPAAAFGDGTVGNFGGAGRTLGGAAPGIAARVLGGGGRTLPIALGGGGAGGGFARAGGRGG